MCKNTRKQFKTLFLRWKPDKVLFDIFLVAVYAVIAIAVSLQLARGQEVAMIYFWIFAGILFLCALLTLIRISIEPKDTRLDTLITKIDELIEVFNKDKKSNVELLKTKQGRKRTPKA